MAQVRRDLQTPMFLALDAGASHVRAVLAGPRGPVLAHSEAGPANPYALGAEAADRQRRRAIRACLRQARIPPQAIAAVAIGSAGISQGAGARDLARRTRRILPGARVRVVTDGEIAHIGALRGQAGITIISGTGSIVWGRSRSGAWARAGGWGWLLGDEGSGQWLGRQAYAAVLRALDGSGPRTSLTPRLLRQLRLPSPQAVATAPRPASPAAFGALAPALLAAARARDAVARAIVAQGAEALAAQAHAVARRLRMRQPPVSYQGSALTSSPLLRAALRRALARQLPGAALRPPAGTPLAGALRLARQLLA